jgi:hypothetical protein
LPLSEDSSGETGAGKDIHVLRRSAVLPPARYRRVDLVVPRGAVVFMHGHLVHGSHNNRSRDRFRRSFVMTYLRRGAPFRAGRDGKRTETDCYNLD